MTQALTSTNTHPLARVAAVRQIEEITQRDLPAGELMRRAGRRAARLIAQVLRHGDAPAGRRAAQGDAPILVFVGPGDNGGDGRIAGLCLDAMGFAVQIVEPGKQPDFVACEAALDQQVVPRAVIDALFGIGLTRPIQGSYAEAVKWINQLPQSCIRIALDVPSGLNAETGIIVGATDGVAVRADMTVTFLIDKPGLHMGAGRDLCGRIALEPLSEDLVLTENLAVAATTHPAPVGRLFEHSAARRTGPRLRRSANRHKGDSGSVAIIGGAPGMAGAALLAGRAAVYAGAGRTFIGFPGGAPLPVDPQQPELMLKDATVLLQPSNPLLRTIAIGPGLGTDAGARQILEAALMLATDSPITTDSGPIGASDQALDQSKSAASDQALHRPKQRCVQALVLDADALNLLAGAPELAHQVRRLGQDALPDWPIVTPHPLEAARLLGSTVRLVQADRISAACAIANALQCLCVLKGSGTVVAAPNGVWWIVGAGNPVLATGGTGDLLTGLIAGFLAQGLTSPDAALLGVWCHGRGADEWVANGHPAIGASPSELLPWMRSALHECSTLAK
jgi:hydroxyethylthiazole kinase-like uncharacterized protein yjeF